MAGKTRYVRIVYLYRSATNWKTHDRIVLREDLGLSAEEIAEALRPYLIPLPLENDTYAFNPVQVGLPALHSWNDIWDFDPRYDHSVHEIWLDTVEVFEDDLDLLDDDNEDAPLTLSDLLNRFQRAFASGWVFEDPQPVGDARPCVVFLDSEVEGAVIPIESVFTCPECQSHSLQIVLPYNAHGEDNIPLYVAGFLQALPNIELGIVVTPDERYRGDLIELPSREFPVYMTFCARCRAGVDLAHLNQKYLEVQNGLVA